MPIIKKPKLDESLVEIDESENESLESENELLQSEDESLQSEKEYESEFICDNISSEDNGKGIVELLKVSIPEDFNVDYSKLIDVILSDIDLALVMRSTDDPKQSDVNSLTTVIGLKKHKNEPSIIQLKESLDKFLSEIDNGSELLDILNNTSNNVGLLINERTSDVPEMTTKVLETLFDDIRSFAVDDESLRYTHYCMFLMYYKPHDADEIVFFSREMKAVFDEFPVKSSIKIESEALKDQGYRAIVVFRADEIDRFLSLVKCNSK